MLLTLICVDVLMFRSDWQQVCNLSDQDQVPNTFGTM